METTYKARTFRRELVVSTYGYLNPTGGVKLVDVRMDHKTIRERRTTVLDMPKDDAAKLRFGEWVLVSGLTMKERDARK